MGKLTIECDVGKVSDGYHTFDELYEHRCLLFVALMLSNPAISWRAMKHADGTAFDGWFIAGMHLPTGDVSYHLPMVLWPMTTHPELCTKDIAPDWDGHTAADVVKRLTAWCEQNSTRAKEGKNHTPQALLISYKQAKAEHRASSQCAHKSGEPCTACHFWSGAISAISELLGQPGVID